MAKNKPTRSLILLLLMLTVMLCVTGMCVLKTDAIHFAMSVFGLAEGSWTPSNIAESERRGQQVAEKVRDMRARDGFLPKSLEAAFEGPVPVELRPTAGWPTWHYEVDPTGAKFTIGFSANKGLYPSRWLSSESAFWRADE